MPLSGNDIKLLFAPLETGASSNNKKMQERDKEVAELTEDINELRKVNDEVRAARHAALNVMEDALQSKEALRKTEEKYRLKLEKEVQEYTADLQASRNQYASLVENTPDIITRWNKFLELVFANAAFSDK